MATPVMRLGMSVGRVFGGVLGCGGVAGRLTPLAAPLHTSPPLDQYLGPRRWTKNNNKIYPPTPFGEKERPAFVCHVKSNIKYSPDKMWYVACLVRGLKIDDAISQLQFVHKKGATAAIQTLEEARQMALQDHYVEYPSNLWVSDSSVGKGLVYKGYRRHARKRFGRVEYKHCHYFVTLEEGDPPQDYYTHRSSLTPEEMLTHYLEGLRRRNVPYAL